MMTTGKYILDDDRKPLLVDDLMVWAEWFEGANRVVDRTSIGPVDVSTVFLGTDHGTGDGQPVLFETMIFFQEEALERTFSNNDGERTCTWAEAEQAHERWCDTVRREDGGAWERELMAPPTATAIHRRREAGRCINCGGGKVTSSASWEDRGQVAGICPECCETLELRAVPIDRPLHESERWRDEMLVAILRRSCTGPGVPSPHEGDLITEYERAPGSDPSAG